MTQSLCTRDMMLWGRREAQLFGCGVVGTQEGRYRFWWVGGEEVPQQCSKLSIHNVNIWRLSIHGKVCNGNVGDQELLSSLEVSLYLFHHFKVEI